MTRFTPADPRTAGLSGFVVGAAVDGLVLVACDAAFDGVSISNAALPLAVAILSVPPFLLLRGLRRLAARASDEIQMGLISCSFMLLMLLAIPLLFVLLALAAYFTPGFQIAGVWVYLATASAILAADFLLDHMFSRRNRAR